MTRPLYETSASRSAEEEVVRACAAAWKCEWLKLKIAAEIDYVLHRNGDVVAVMEVKDRTAGKGYSSEAMDRIGGYMLSACKYQAAKRWIETHTVPFILAVRLTDGIFWRKWEGATERVSLRLGGRVDRGDWQDVEPCVFLPMARFKRLREP